MSCGVGVIRTEPATLAPAMPATVCQLLWGTLQGLLSDRWMQTDTEAAQVSIVVSYTLLKPMTEHPRSDDKVRITVQLFGPLAHVVRFQDSLEQIDPRFRLSCGQGQMLGDCQHGSASLVWQLSTREPRRDSATHPRFAGVRSVAQVALSFRQVASEKQLAELVSK